MQGTRVSILNYLEAHPPSSADEIGRYLEMTAANIRYHLQILEEEGFVQVSGKRSPGGAGRPILLYSLTALTLEDNLAPLLGGLLALIQNSDARDQLLAEAAEGLIKGELEPRKNRVQRFNQGIAFLNTRHYHASWEARPGGPRVALRHCPYQDLAQTHPVLCQLDQVLLQQIFGTKLTLAQKRTFGKNPFSPCIFKSQ